MKTNIGVYPRILRMLIGTAVVLLIILSVLFVIKNKQERIMFEESQLQFQKEVNSIIALKTATLRQVAYDYTYWDEFIDKLETKDTAWFNNNITTILKSFRVDYVCVFDTLFNIVHEASIQDSLSQRFIETGSIARLKETRFLNFYQLTDQGVMEVSSASIHPETDPSHTFTKPRGYLYLARKWDNRILDEFSGLCAAKVSILLPDDTMSNLDKYSVFAIHDLPGWNGENAAQLFFSRISNSFLLYHNMSLYVMMIIVFSFLTIFLLFHFTTRLWINNPLKLVMSILKSDDPALINELQKSYGEFKNIGFLFGEFINQKKELKIAKEKAEESETRFKALHNASFGGIAIHDKGIILDCNYGLTQISGFSQEELIGMDGLLLIHENSRQMVMNNILAEYEKPYEASGVRKNGEEYPVRLEGKMIPYKGKKVRVVEFRDITEQKNAEQEIIKAKERAEESEGKIQQKNQELSERNVFIQTILDNLPIGLSLNYLKEGNATYMNKKFEEIYGWSSSDITSIAEFFEKVYPDKNYREQIISRIMADINSGDTTKMHWENIKITNKNGSQKFVNAVNIPLFEQNTMVSTVIDITELYQVQQQLINAKEKAEESDRLKSAFLANMSHEIRTPMNGILGFAELLKEPGLTGEDQNKYIAVIEKSGERMLNIINDIIDISKIEAGQVKVERSGTDINDLSEFVCNFFAPEIKKKGLTFTCSIPKSENHLIVSTDKEKLYAILTNLVKNAIKYTPKGNIEFGFKVVGVTGRLPLQFYVKDTGIGIPKDRQQAIFDRFVQADIEDIKAMEGAGLGLAISKAYAEMLGGTIHVESEQGEGSIFWLNLPLQHSAGNIPVRSIKNDLEIEVPATLKDFTVLIAEDEVTSDLYLTEILKAEFKNILHASTGTETIELLRKNQNIRFILMDIKMPLMNGYEATRMIRTFNKDVIIIAQTAYALPGDCEKALEAGCNDYISKPVKKDLLFSILRHYLTKNTNE